MGIAGNFLLNLMIGIFMLVIACILVFTVAAIIVSALEVVI